MSSGLVAVRVGLIVVAGGRGSRRACLDPDLTVRGSAGGPPTLSASLRCILTVYRPLTISSYLDKVASRNLELCVGSRLCHAAATPPDSQPQLARACAANPRHSLAAIAPWRAADRLRA